MQCSNCRKTFIFQAADDGALGMFKNMANKCVGKDGITKKDIDALFASTDFDMANFDSFKCVITCIGEQIGVVS